VVEIDPKIIIEVIIDAQILSDHVILKTDENSLYIIAKGDLGNVEVKVSKDEAIAFDVRKEATSMFSIEYLKDMIRASDIATSVRISLGANIPGKADFMAENARLSFLLAPRIESE
jgi:hypothetical protein